MHGLAVWQNCFLSPPDYSFMCFRRYLLHSSVSFLPFSNRHSNQDNAPPHGTTVCYAIHLHLNTKIYKSILSWIWMRHNGTIHYSFSEIRLLTIKPRQITYCVFVHVCEKISPHASLYNLPMSQFCLIKFMWSQVHL